MAGFTTPFSASDDDMFDTYNEYVPEHIPRPGSFLEDQDVLTDQAHIEFHNRTSEIFEERGVYDMTFGYNLARLNLDRRHPNAGYRYAEEENDATILRAVFTPTTPFCPQSYTLSIGSFRAWNGLRDPHEYELVRVRVHGMHHRSDAINEELERLESMHSETGSTARDSDGMEGWPPSAGQPGCAEREGRDSTISFWDSVSDRGKMFGRTDMRLDRGAISYGRT